MMTQCAEFSIPLSHDISLSQPPHGHNTRSSPYVTLINHLYHSNSLIAPSDMLHLIFGTSFLYHSEFLIQIFHPPPRSATFIF